MIKVKIQLLSWPGYSMTDDLNRREKMKVEFLDSSVRLRVYFSTAPNSVFRISTNTGNNSSSAIGIPDFTGSIAR